jgi:pimeloyl-ACP methyl ester carboxylesterase
VGAGTTVTTVVDSGLEQIFVRHAGEGPLILLLHGFPETSVCWQRHLIPIAEAGYQAAAIDLRGMGQSSVPTDERAYSILASVGDLVAVARQLGHERFHVVGNDLGALVAWHAGLVRPDAVLSVTGLSLPYFARGGLPPLQLLGMLATEESTPYLLRFVEDGAEEEMEQDPRGWVDACMASISGLVPPGERLSGMVPTTGPVHRAFIDGIDPSFLTVGERAELADAYGATGFGGAMSWYRRIDPDWRLLAPWAYERIAPPCQFVGGEADPVRLIADGAINELPYVTRDLRGVTQMPDVGHWPHLEAPDPVRSLILALCDDVRAAAAS